MATRILARSMLTKLSLSSPSLSLSLSTAPRSSFSAFLRLRPLSVAAASVHPRLSPAFTGIRSLATRASTSSLNDPNPNWSNRPPKETILLDGCDFEHWLVVMEKPEGEPTRDEIIDSYIKTLATVVGSEEEARMKIYSVSTRCYFAFGCLVSEELSYKLKEIPRVRWVLPDSYLDVRNKDYGGEPFINGQAVPYDPKYHEEWIKNNARAQERNRRNDRPRNFDRSRNFERRRENMQSRDFQNRDMPPPPPPPPSPNVQNPATGGMGGAPQHNMGVPPPYQNMPQNNMGGMPQNNMGGMPQNNMGGMPQNNMGGVPQNMGRMMPNMGGGMPPPPNSMGGMPHSNMGGVPPSANSNGGMPHNNMGGMAHNNMGGMSHNMGGVPPSPNSMGGMPHNMGGGMPPTPNNMGGGMPPTPNNMGGVPPSPNSMGGMPHNNMGGGMPPPPNSMGGVPQNNMGRMPPPPNSMGGMPPNDGGGLPPNNMGVPPRGQGNVPNYQNSGGYQGEQYQNNNYGQNLGNIPGGNPYQN